MYAVSKCVFLLGFHLILKKSFNVGVEMGVATRRAQMVWPMMTVTVRDSLGSNFENVNFGRK